MSIVYFLGPLAIILSCVLQFAADNTEYATESLNLLLASLTLGYGIFWLGMRLCLGRQAAERTSFWLAVLWLLYSLAVYMPLAYFLGLKGVEISTWIGIPLLLLLFVFHKKLPYSPTIHGALLVIGLASCAAAFPSVLAIYAEHPVPEGYHDVELALAGKTPAVKPHILYIVPDRYPSPMLSRDMFHHDNAAFINMLEERGFYTWDGQFSNYGKTFLSLASTLNMNYLDDTFAELSGVASYLPVIEQMQDNQLLRILKANGYQYTHMGGWWQPTKASPFADSSLFADGMGEFAGIYLLTTPLGYVSQHLEAVRSTCERMPLQSDFALEATRKKDPQFIFWHIFSVHPPYIFDEQGHCASYPVNPNGWEAEKRMIANQLPPTNKQLLQLIDSIREESSRPVIIMIQADEGPIPQALGATPDYLQLSPELKRVKYGIMNAIYLPSGHYEGFAGQQSPVNNFRLVLREIFQTPLPLLDHRHYSFRHENMPYDMHDISAELHGEDRKAR